MSPALRSAIAAAEALAWLPTRNLANATLYEIRMEAATSLVERIAEVRAVSANATPELRYLVAAMRRAARASYSNRCGDPYFERREAIYQLRGCLDVWRGGSALAPAHA